MLIYSSTLLDLVLGTVALLIVFVIMKFLLTESSINLDRLKHRTKIKTGYKKEKYQPAVEPEQDKEIDIEEE